ncbi:MAG: hydrogenase maturation peptidase HycI [Clostridiales bacterium]|nr:hydrogenase maturation peptidase HycI [Clostridiales bacterium]
MLKEHLDPLLTKARRVVILGAGSELRGDDAAGMLLVRQLEELLGDLPEVLLIAGSTAPENFSGQIKSFAPDLLLIADAAHLEEKPGTVGIIPPEQIKGISFSTHMLPFSLLLQYLQAEIGCPVLILGIQPKSTEFGTEISPVITEAVTGLAEDLTSLIREHIR